MKNDKFILTPNSYTQEQWYEIYLKVIEEYQKQNNEIVRLKRTIKDVIKICENEKKYIYDKPKRDENTGKLIYGNKIEVDLVNKTKILDILKQYNLTLEQLNGVENE